MDTRTGVDNVGPRSQPLGPVETYELQAAGVAQGNCTIPAGTQGLVLNVTAINGTAWSYLTVWPSDTGRPLASNLNWGPGQGPTPNQVTVGLSPSGSLSLFNQWGQVDIFIDVTGYFTEHNPDERYYTKTEVDDLIAANASPAASLAEVTLVVSEPPDPWDPTGSGTRTPLPLDCPDGMQMIHVGSESSGERLGEPFGPSYGTPPWGRTPTGALISPWWSPASLVEASATHTVTGLCLSAELVPSSASGS